MMRKDMNHTCVSENPVMRKVMKGRCLRCGLPGIYEFGDIRDGECKFCRNFKRKTFLGEEQMLRDLDVQDGEKIGITLSGGKDSCYMAGKLADLLGPDKVTAFFYYKPGLTSSVARDNVEKVRKTLGINVETVEDTQAFSRFRKNLEVVLRHPDPALTRIALCVGCRFGITENLYRRGEEMGIMKYMSGASYLELAPFKEELLAAKSLRNDINEGFEIVLNGCPALHYGNNRELMIRDNKYKYKNNDTEQNNFGTSYRYRLFDFDNYFENNPEEVERAVTERFDWKKTDRSWHFDCVIEEFKDVFYFGNLGYTELDFKLAAMVRYGLISREEAMNRIREQAESISRSFTDFKGKLIRMGLSHCLDDLRNLYKELPYLNYKEEENEIRNIY